MSEVVRFGVAMERDLLERFDALVQARGLARNRSEAVRDLARAALSEAHVEDPQAEVVGTVTIVFDHHTSDLSEKLDALQHHHFRQIVSKLHVHLDAHNCLEVIIVRGKSRQVHAMAEALIGAKGVQHGQVVITAVSAVAAGAVGAADAAVAADGDTGAAGA
jgi:CopG family nickel-responsive transcriptional regulator